MKKHRTQTITLHGNKQIAAKLLAKVHKGKHTSKKKEFVHSIPIDFWGWLVVQRTFENAISKQGYFEIDRNNIASSYRAWNEKVRGLRGPAISIPSLFITEYYSQTPQSLKNAGYYLMRAGNGNSIVFDSSIFPPPFLNLNGMHWDAEEVVVKRKGHATLKNAFKTQWNEQSFLNALHFCGAFDKLVKKVCNASGYELGPSGPISSSFPFYMKDKKNRLKRFVYSGVYDLDECLYPDCKGSTVIMPIEAKVTSHYDLAWHKLAFPCNRFIYNGFPFQLGPNNLPIQTRIIPIYCMYDEILHHAYLYVFREIEVLKKRNWMDKPENGLVLNNAKQLTPAKIYKVDMRKALSS